ncbi:MAG: hypothetical protein VX346_26080, partial [Planctomycetota bacterium]|nr:hypothetical protein [Planctomycetota bacterium]
CPTPGGGGLSGARGCLFLRAARVGAPRALHVRWPEIQKTTPSDFLLKLDFRWVAGNGYRPIRVSVAPRGKPFGADRRLDIRLELEGMLANSRRRNVRQTLLVPAGSAGITETIYVPEVANPYGRYSLKIFVFEGGREHRALRHQRSWGLPQQSPEDRPRILIIDSDAPAGDGRNRWVTRWPGDRRDRRQFPDFRPMAWHMWKPNALKSDYLGATKDASLLGLVERISELELLHPADLPDRWIGYSTLDLVFISLADLEQMVEQHPTRWEALRFWVATGPVLCVHGTGSEREPFLHLEALERRLRLSALPEVVGKAVAYRGWRTPLEGDFTRKDASFHADHSQHMTPYVVAGSTQLARTAVTTTERPPDPYADRRSLESRRLAAKFLYRSIGLGRVVALGATRAFPGTLESWRWLSHTLHPRKVAAKNELLGSPTGIQRLTWTGRHGMSFSSGNMEYWNWLVPGVGLPPVTTFLVAISLFVVVIGPLNYWLLRRVNKLFLLLLTVPLGATVVTLFLMAYALLADGLGIRGRVRSLTHLDQTAGVAVSWSRQTYYAAIAPSRGLSFPDTATVYQIEPVASRSRNRDSRARNILWADRQRLSGGYLRSRVAGQFLVTNARRVPLRIDIDREPEGCRVRNRLGTRILGLLLRDTQDRWFANVPSSAASDPATLRFGKAIAADAEVTLVPLAGSGMPLLQQAYRSHQPQEPAGFDPATYGTASRNYFFRERDEEVGFQHSVLESLNQPDWILPARSYVAITDKDVLDSGGLDEASSEGSFHVLVGEW